MVLSLHCSAAFWCRRALRLSAAILSAGSVFAQSASTSIVAHRAAAELFPENTGAAIRSCAGLADLVEFDVRTSADGELVLMHDETVDRTTDGTGFVAALDLASLKTLDAGAEFSPRFAGERIPTLAEALHALPPGIPALVDCKVAAPAAVAAALRAGNALDGAIVVYGSWNFLEEIHRLEPRLALAAAGGNASGGPLTPGKFEYFKSVGIGHLLWDKRDVSPDLVALVHSNGLKIHVSIAADEVAFYAAMGVDGVIVGNPAAARKQLAGAPAPARSVANPLAAGVAPANRQAGIPGPDAAGHESPASGYSPTTRNIARPRGTARLPAARDCIAYWKLDDGLSDPSSVNAEDAFETSRGRLVGYASDPGWLSGNEAFAGGALRFNGASHYVRIPPNEVLDVGTNAVSLSMWIKLAALPADLPAAVACVYGSDLAAYVLYLDKTSNELRFRVTDAAGHSAAPGIPAAALHIGVWHHVVGVYDGSSRADAGETRVFLDGQLRDTHLGADASPDRGLTGPVRTGQFAALGRHGDRDESYFAGAIDDVALWRRPLSPAEILAIYARGQEGLPLD